MNILHFSFTVCAQGEESDDFDTNLRFHQHDRPCSYRRHQGFCKKRSECNKPSRHICRFGSDPHVCCLDKVDPTTTTTTTKRPHTTKRSTVKPENLKNIDLTFPRKY